ncbi:MAG: hypothetical protein D6706_02120 [Chloroflexi bacterium]|nr:MAG: hypothetical protein D6706_02120 [Chloroflexota bacterium]
MEMPMQQTIVQNTSTLNAALAYVGAGLSVIPVLPNKRPAIRWTEQQSKIPAAIEIYKWFRPAGRNVAIVGGAVSGGLLIIDFDQNADAIFPAWQQMVGELAYWLPVVRTGKGYHVYLRCDEPGRNRKLATSAAGVLIETRGEGGYVLAPPSKHPSGRSYELVQGNLLDIPHLSSEQVEKLITAAEFFDEPAPAPTSPQQPEPLPNVPNGLAKKDGYIQAAIRNEMAAVINAPRGDRNNQLFRSTAALANFIGSGLLSESDVVNAMKEAASTAGLVAEEAAQTERTIQSGLKRGRSTPRDAPETGKVALDNGSPAAVAKPDIDVRNPKTKDFLAAFAMLGFSFRVNELDDTIEVNGKPITDGIAATIRNRVRDIGLTSVSRMTDAWTQAAYENAYNPIKDFLKGLTWDGSDHIGAFVSNYLTETTGFGQVAFRRWMVGSVAKIFENAQNFMLVWDGPQGIGKSMLARWLCPLPSYFIEGPIRPDDKDFLIRLCTKWIWEVSELQSTTRKADREALKGFITTQEVTVRKAYARYDIVKPAMVSMIGTINEDGAGFLTDPTGNRRFVIINIQEINWDYQKHVDPKLMWAQAYGLYKAGESWRLTPDESKQRDAINAEYEMNSSFADFFFEYYRYDPNSDHYEPATAILKNLKDAGLGGSIQANQNELSRLMKKLGAKKSRIRVLEGRPTAYRGVLPRLSFLPSEDVPDGF